MSHSELIGNFLETDFSDPVDLEVLVNLFSEICVPGSMFPHLFTYYCKDLFSFQRNLSLKKPAGSTNVKDA